MEPDLTARKRLGNEVRQARKRAGLSKTAEWADRVGRSDRVLLGLERGESVGPDTYAAVADALGWTLDRLYSILAGEPVLESSTASTGLASVSNEEIAAEVLRRMKAGEHGGRDTAATNVRELSSGAGSQVQKKAAQSKPRTD